jgi:hypothetical protein
MMVMMEMDMVNMAWHGMAWHGDECTTPRDTDTLAIAIIL